MARHYKSYGLDQRMLLPVDMREWLPEGHLARFIVELVGELDLSAFCDRSSDGRGREAHNPLMLVAVLIYAYCVGMPSSRKIEKATYEDVAFRVLAGNSHPDHDVIAAFRKKHLQAFRKTFVDVLQLCAAAGLVKLGHVSIDGTKFGANASKHKAMSYGRMIETEARLVADVERMTAEAEAIDAAEDAKFGKGTRGDELPKELQRSEDRLKKIREAKAVLEANARAAAEAKAREAKAKLEERAKKQAETGIGSGGRPPTVPDVEAAKPDDKAQRNFTDPESRIMPDGANKGAFVQAYNAQIAVDSMAQVIVAITVTQQTNDKLQLVPMAEKIIENVGRLADVTSADAGYFSEAAVTNLTLAGTNLLVPPDRLKRHESVQPTDATAGEIAPTPIATMRAKVRSAVGHALYKMRKAIVEPVFGQIKGVRGLRRFSMRGLAAVEGEWSLIALTHNLLKLWRSRALTA